MGTLLAGLGVEALVVLFLAAVLIVMFEVPAAGRWMPTRVPRWVRWPVWMDEPGQRVTWLIQLASVTLMALGLVGLIFDTEVENFLRRLSPRLAGLQDLSPELVGIAVTVLVIDTLNKYRSWLDFKQQTFRQIRHSSNPFAIEALETARAMGWWDEIIRPGTDLSGAKLQQANLSHAELQGAILWGVDLREANLLNAKLQGANLGIAKLERARLSGAKLQGANLDGANLYKARLFNVKLQGAILSSADLYKARLGSAKLKRAILSSAILYEADLTGAKLEGAIYNDDTIWPAGFDRVAAGVIHWNELNEDEKDVIRQRIDSFARI